MSVYPTRYILYRTVILAATWSQELDSVHALLTPPSFERIFSSVAIENCWNSINTREILLPNNIASELNKIILLYNFYIILWLKCFSIFRHLYLPEFSRFNYSVLMAGFNFSLLTLRRRSFVKPPAGKCILNENPSVRVASDVRLFTRFTNKCRFPLSFYLIGHHAGF